MKRRVDKQLPFERRHPLLMYATARALSRLRVAPGSAAEATYMRYLVELCESLIRHNGAALAALAEQVPLELLAHPAQRQLIGYYRALGAGLADRLFEARQRFAVLLAEPDIDVVVRGRALNSSSLFAQIQGDYEQALAGYQAASAIWQRLGETRRQGLAALNRGILHYELQRYPLAEADLQAALALFVQVGDEHSAALAHTELALVHRDLGGWAESLADSQRALALFETLGADDSAGRVRNNIGEVLLLQGDFAAALNEFAAAEQLMTTQVYAVELALNRGLIAQTNGDPVDALAHYTAALHLAEAIERSDVVPLCHYRIGRALENREPRTENQEPRTENTAPPYGRSMLHPSMLRPSMLRPDATSAKLAAMEHYRAAIAAIEAHREPLRDEGLLLGLMGRWQEAYAAAMLLAIELGEPAAAFAFAEQGRARAFADMIARRAQLSAPQVEPVSVAELQAALPPGTLMLCYVSTGVGQRENPLFARMPAAASELRACLEFPPRLLCFAVTYETMRIVPCALDPKVLHSAAPGLADGRRFLRPAILHHLYKALLAPVADLIDVAGEIILVPHGPLHQVPFAALRDANGHVLLDQVQALRYTPSATVFVRGAQNFSNSGKGCLALGYDGGARTLRHTEAEAASIAAQLNGVFLRGADGALEQFIALAGAYGYLHLACHGQFDTRDPLASWLELGPGERLSAADVIERLRLHADLVVLSACRSGVSQILRGDEPLGLARAFLQAGARAVLVTLWPVEDRSAHLLMKRFYTALLAEEEGDATTALAIAQRSLRASESYADESFWAPYVLITSGDGRTQ